MLSIFTTTSNPFERQDPIEAALECYLDVADEVVVVVGDRASVKPVKDLLKKLNKKHKRLTKVLYKEWPEEFSWERIGEQFQYGYDNCTGDWVIRMDLDYIFHQDHIPDIYMALMRCVAPAASFYKWQFILVDRYNVKSRLVLAFNKRDFGERITLNGGGDLCQPMLDGKELTIEEVPQVGYPIFNYDWSFKTKKVAAKELLRFARAWERRFKEDRLGAENEREAVASFKAMQIGRYHKASKKIPKAVHPK